MPLKPVTDFTGRVQHACTQTLCKHMFEMYAVLCNQCNLRVNGSGAPLFEGRHKVEVERA